MGIKYGESTIYEICRRIDTGEEALQTEIKLFIFMMLQAPNFGKKFIRTIPCKKQQTI